MKKNVSIIGGADGPTSIFVVGRKEKNILKRIKIAFFNRQYKRKRALAEKSIVPYAHTIEEVIQYIQQRYSAVEADCSYPYYQSRKRIATDYHLFIINKGELGSLEIEMDTLCPHLSVSYSGDKKIMAPILKDIYLYFGVSKEDTDHQTERYMFLLTALTFE